MINREKAARLLMVWREVQSGGKLRVQDTANITGINLEWSVLCSVHLM